MNILEELTSRVPNRKGQEKPTSGHNVGKLKNIQNSKKHLTSREKEWIIYKVSESHFQQQTGMEYLHIVFHPNSKSTLLKFPKIVKTKSCVGTCRFDDKIC